MGLSKIKANQRLTNLGKAIAVFFLGALVVHVVVINLVSCLSIPVAWHRAFYKLR